MASMVDMVRDQGTHVSVEIRDQGIQESVSVERIKNLIAEAVE